MCISNCREILQHYEIQGQKVPAQLMQGLSQKSVRAEIQITSKISKNTEKQVYIYDMINLLVSHNIQCYQQATYYLKYLIATIMKPFLSLLLLTIAACQTENLLGKIFAGYQGWFAHPDDGSGIGSSHLKIREGPYARDNCVIDFWPQSDEYERKYPSPEFGPGFSMFSSYDYSTVRTHFRWLVENSIHGVFLQRFGSDLRDKGSNYWKFKNKVFENVRQAASQSGRYWCLMYDLTGLTPGQIRNVIMEDFKFLSRTYNFANDPYYVKHKGRPLVTVWGVGFNDNRQYSLAQCAELVDFLKNGQFGGHSVMIGTPRYWREGGGDAVTGADLKMLHNILMKSDVISPWTVGRYGTIEAARNDAKIHVKADLTWCAQNKLTLMPVIFPGFSWHNLQVTTHHPNPGPYNQIPRKQGGLYFLREQGVAITNEGAKTIYVAMFDEMNEGTSIFKCTKVTPSLADGLKFVGYEEEPNFYLQLTGIVGKMIK